MRSTLAVVNALALLLAAVSISSAQPGLAATASDVGKEAKRDSEPQLSGQAFSRKSSATAILAASCKLSFVPVSATKRRSIMVSENVNENQPRERSETRRRGESASLSDFRSSLQSPKSNIASGLEHLSSSRSVVAEKVNEDQPSEEVKRSETERSGKSAHLSDIESGVESPLSDIGTGHLTTSTLPDNGSDVKSDLSDIGSGLWTKSPLSDVRSGAESPLSDIGSGQKSPKSDIGAGPDGSPLSDIGSGVESPVSDIRSAREADATSETPEGVRVASGTYQYTVLLKTNLGQDQSITSDEKECTGSLLDDRHVLAAASCVVFGSRTEERMETSDFQVPSVVLRITLGLVWESYDEESPGFVAMAEAIFVHSDYDVGLADTDIAVIRLDRKVGFTDGIRPVCLASAQDKLPRRCSTLAFRGTRTGCSLQRATNILMYTQRECRHNMEDEIYRDYLTAFGTTLTSEADQALRVFLSVVTSSKLCSVVENDQQGVQCPQDVGGPVMCTPLGTARDERYDDPEHEQFNHTDLSFKQFGLYKGSFSPGCSKQGSVTFTTSVQYHRMWLEFVALPLLLTLDQGAALAFSERFLNCMRSVMDWRQLKAELGFRGYELTTQLKNNICRKYATYRTCQEHHPDPIKCDNLETLRVKVEVFPHKQPFLELDLFHYFRRKGRSGALATMGRVGAGLENVNVMLIVFGLCVVGGRLA